MNTEPSPCPFCASKGVLTSLPPFLETPYWRHSYQCTECLASTDYYRSADEALAAWNIRTTPKPEDP